MGLLAWAWATFSSRKRPAHVRNLEGVKRGKGHSNAKGPSAPGSTRWLQCCGVQTSPSLDWLALCGWLRGDACAVQAALLRACNDARWLGYAALALTGLRAIGVPPRVRPACFPFSYLALRCGMSPWA